MAIPRPLWFAAAALVAAVAANAPAATADPAPAPPAPAPAPPIGSGLLAGQPNPGAVVDAPPPPDPQVQSFGPLGAVAGAPMDQLTLGQRPPSGQPGDAGPNDDLLSAGAYLNPNQYRVPGDRAPNQYQLQTSAPGPFARIDGFKGLHAMLHGALGRMPAPQLSEPLPGTAPPEDAALPPGPVENLPPAPTEPTDVPPAVP
ncbi:hypothetical protein [Mycolicibacterium brumae]|uniref:hypothetical protein n=1 Tax=Mycolicibacterium brumae TaxID=85968 RepID=UPI000A401583|nr:hypothetical protein [Mycolicibacterium brumae]MCV7192452.1 hypothetical protein [Mycolicibacterium brumae]UWW10220.1 hypothetical protein L2Z93_003347 [Mycolicibacterium brumae]